MLYKKEKPEERAKTIESGKEECITEYLFFLTALLACVIGKICGMGGGVIIKPVLDSCGLLSVAAINLLSGCTVIGMSAWSVGKTLVKKEKAIDLRSATPLAAGAAVGGITGKILFSAIAKQFEQADRAGGVQAILLLTATAATLIYTLKKDRLTSYAVTNPVLIVLIGLVLGLLGSFLGIGGGPFNMAVLFLFFSMKTKTASQNSLYVILISQTAGLVYTLLRGNVPTVSALLLIGMVGFGILGSEIGGRIHTRITEKTNTRLFEAAMILVMAICLYNIRLLFA